MGYQYVSIPHRDRMSHNGNRPFAIFILDDPQAPAAQVSPAPVVAAPPPCWGAQSPMRSCGMSDFFDENTEKVQQLRSTLTKLFMIGLHHITSNKSNNSNNCISSQDWIDVNRSKFALICSNSTSIRWVNSKTKFTP